MVENCFLSKEAGLFGDVVYRPTASGRVVLTYFNKGRSKRWSKQ